ncbi:hypothetical protein [Novacetimonas pomaceti]|uniref:WXG100 family type VII secretion target n=1 Tax=Novacetimonas pomaceti TaxID=2021998 RepID=A0ABX5P4M3_9PROT|nr:hypothetical protein [Novacetimonas pomaceti]PYD47236.1 hypothetical protein C3920_10970 [Novacetimonas pomaceti]
MTTTRGTLPDSLDLLRRRTREAHDDLQALFHSVQIWKQEVEGMQGTWQDVAGRETIRKYVITDIEGRDEVVRQLMQIVELDDDGERATVEAWKESLANRQTIANIMERNDTFQDTVPKLQAATRMAEDTTADSNRHANDALAQMPGT